MMARPTTVLSACGTDCSFSSPVLNEIEVNNLNHSSLDTGGAC